MPYPSNRENISCMALMWWCGDACILLQPEKLPLEFEIIISLPHPCSREWGCLYTTMTMVMATRSIYGAQKILVESIWNSYEKYPLARAHIVVSRSCSWQIILSKAQLGHKDLITEFDHV